MRSLIIVDLQNDFLPGGALAVADGDQVVPIINQLIPRFDLVVATQDWHPIDHKSFAANHSGASVGEVIDLNGLSQVLWPVHCVQHSPGATLCQALDRESIAKIFTKGMDREVDSYSGFFDNDRRNSTGLGDYLREQGAKELFVVGLATDYCVKFTALDAQSLGFKTTLVQDACRGVNLNPSDVENAVGAMRDAGIEINQSATIG